MMLKAFWPVLFLGLIFGSVASVSGKSVDTTGFGKADAHARAASAKSVRSIDELSQALTAPFKTEALKARAIYTWVIHNIRYDVDRAFTNRPAAYMSAAEANSKSYPQSPEVVLSSKVAVCQGYSNLLRDLCKSAGIDALTISGYDKGWFYQRNGTLTLSHAWNIVRIDGQWYPVDATWGAGHADENKKFVSQPSYEFFMTAPEEFVVKHLPSDPAYQLLPKPVPMEVFKAKAEAVSAYIAANQGRGASWDDTLSAEAAMEPTLREYHSMRRSLAYQPQNHWARLKLAEFHASRAMEVFARYQKALEEAKAQKAPPGPQALSLLDDAEAELTQSGKWLSGIPGSDKDLSNFASMNSQLIATNLESIRKQKKYWQERH